MAFTESTGINPIDPLSDDARSNITDPWPEVTPSAPYTLVNTKFDEASAIVEDMLLKLQGADGNSGYLGTLNSLISEYSLPATPDLTVDLTLSTPDATVTAPDAEMTGLNTTFAPFAATPPTLASLPTIDTSSLSLVSAPTAPATTNVNFTETALSTDIYTELLARIQADLTTGATGLTATIEADIYARALDRATTDNDRKTDEINNLYSGSRWDAPSGAYVAALAELSEDIGRTNRIVNTELAKESFDLAQRNTQFIIQQAVALEGLLRSTRDSESNRALDKAKADVVNALQKYDSDVRAYVAEMEANKIYIEAQLGALQGAVEYNKSLNDSYNAQAQAYKTTTDAQASANQAIADVYKAEIQGYEALTKAKSTNEMVKVENNKAQIAKAEVELKAIIAEIENSLQGYVSEMALRERVSNDMAQIASQAVASALASTNVNASMGYSGSESRNESFGHSESLSQGVSFTQSLSESHSYEHEPPS